MLLWAGDSMSTQVPLIGQTASGIQQKKIREKQKRQAKMSAGVCLMFTMSPCGEIY